MNQRLEGICELLTTLAPNQSVNAVVTDGFNEPVTNFVNFDEDTHLAYFTNAAGALVVADCRHISLIVFP